MLVAVAVEEDHKLDEAGSVFLVTELLDCRKGPASLTALVKESCTDPFSGALWAFSATALRCEMPLTISMPYCIEGVPMRWDQSGKDIRWF